LALALRYRVTSDLSLLQEIRTLSALPPSSPVLFELERLIQVASMGKEERRRQLAAQEERERLERERLERERVRRERERETC
jgi:hypothetical protein